MADDPSATHTLGLEYEGAHVRGVELYYVRRQVVCYRTFVLDEESEEENVKPLYMSDLGKTLERSAKSSLVVTGMDAGKTIIRQMDVKLKKEKDIDAVLVFQAEPLLPFPVEEAFLDKSFLQSNDEGTLLTLFAVRRDHLQEHIDSWTRLGVEPEIVGSIPHALAVFAGMAIAHTDPVLMLHIGFTSTTCALVQHGKLLSAQAFKGGIHELAEAYLNDTNQEQHEAGDVAVLAEVDCLNIDQPSLPTFSAVLLQFQRDCVRVAYGLAKYAHVADVASVIATGDGSRQLSLAQTIAKAIGKPLATLEIPSSFGLTEEDAHFYAVPIGLALTGLPITPEQINLRQKELAYPHPWKRLRIPIASYIALCVALAFAVYLFGQAYLGLEEDRIRKDYVALVASLNQDYTATEKKIGGAAAAENPIPTPKELTPEQIETRLNFFEKELDAAPNTIALLPNTPRVSDVLAWLGSHPHVSMATEKNAKPDAQIHIEMFNYRLVKRPELSKPRDKYQVQVEMDFTSDSARAARLFYDSLIAPNDFVDPKAEVKWTAAPGKYRIAFYLKDRTIYPNP